MEGSVLQSSRPFACVVHLVHGTFAHDAAWIRADSPFAQAITRGLGGSALIVPFNWSGANSHAGRQRAGRELARCIRDLEQSNPNVPQYVVAHSHGGNVVAYALKEAGVGPLIAGVACLGTPFIKASARDLAGSHSLLQWILTAFVLIALLVTFLVSYGGASIVVQPELAARVARLDQATDKEVIALLATGWFRVTMIAIYGLVAVGLGRVAIRCILSMRHFLLEKELLRLAAIQTALVETLTATFGSTPLLVVDARGDEAAWWLATVSRIASLPYRIWKPGTFVLTAMALLSVHSLVALVFFSPRPIGFGVILAAVLMAVMFFAAATLAVAAVGWLLCLIWPAIFRAHALGFGSDDFLQNFAVEIKSVQTPERSTSMQQETIAVGGAGLRHSRLYQDDRVQLAVSGWFDQRTCNGPGLQQPALSQGRTN